MMNAITPPPRFGALSQDIQTQIADIKSAHREAWKATRNPVTQTDVLLGKIEKATTATEKSDLHEQLLSVIRRIPNGQVFDVVFGILNHSQEYPATPLQTIELERTLRTKALELRA